MGCSPPPKALVMSMEGFWDLFTPIDTSGVVAVEGPFLLDVFLSAAFELLMRLFLLFNLWMFGANLKREVSLVVLFYSP